MKPLLNKSLGAIGVVMVVAMSIGGFSRLLGRTKLRFTYLTGKLPTAEYQELAAKPGWSTASARVASDIELMGLVRRPRAAAAPWVLYYPGNDATPLKRGQAFLSRVAEGEDWGLAVFAYRGYDSSSGTPRVGDLAADAPEILLRLCENEKIVPARVNVVGFSIGGYFAVQAVGALAKQSQPPASLALLAPVADIVMVRRSLFEKLDPGDALLTEPFLGPVRAPVLVVQGGADETLGGPIQGQAVARALGDRARYVELPGVGHNALIETDSAISEVRAFIAARPK